MAKNTISHTASLTSKLLMATALSFSIGLPAFAQVEFNDELKKEAGDACIATASKKGFVLKEIVTVEPDPNQSDRLKIILNLDKEKQEYKLTCYYGTDKVAIFDEDNQTSSTPNNDNQTSSTPVAFTDEVKEEAKNACTDTATQKGFTLNNVVAVEPDPNQPDRLKIVLDLNKEGQQYKLTCYYGTDKVAIFDENQQPSVAETPVGEQPPVGETPVEEQPPVAETPVEEQPPVAETPDTTTSTAVETKTGFPWWLLLIPILGLPLLWFLMKGNDETTTTAESTPSNTYKDPVTPVTTTTTATTTTTTKEVVPVTRAWIRNNGDMVNVYSGPGIEYEILRTIPDDQELLLTGISEGDWIELESGGWIERRFFEVDSNYA